MKIGLIGLPNSGKTTVFNALTKAEASVTAYATRSEKPNLAVVEVDDDRVTRLSEMYQPKKTVYATIELVDFAGLNQGSARDGLFSSESMTLIKNTDAVAIVLRNFLDEAGDAPTPVKDLEILGDELVLSDMIIAENRLERIALAYKRGKKTNQLEQEEKTIQRIVSHLGDGGWIRDLDLSAEQEKAIRGFQFLTKKPLMVILNSEEGRFEKDRDVLEKIEKRAQAVEFAGKFEMELASLTDPEDVELFMADMGLEESARKRLTRLAYQTLGYISFFTVGADEVRAWNIVQDGTALKAAETIHSDLARGFIRAECFSYDDLIRCGSEKGVRDDGSFHLEGKDYIVQDGDIVHIRFNV